MYNIILLNEENKYWPIIAHEIERKMYFSIVNGFYEGKKQYLRKDMVVLIDNQYIEVVETIKKDTISYPDNKNITLDDVRFMKWPNGSHWYCKIGEIDIVDQYGNQKWHDKTDAINAAKWFIEINKNVYTFAQK